MCAMYCGIEQAFPRTAPSLTALRLLQPPPALHFAYMEDENSEDEHWDVWREVCAFPPHVMFAILLVLSLANLFLTLTVLLRRENGP